MIIPVRCFGCGKVLGNKYEYFIKKTQERKQKLNKDPEKISIINLDINNMKKSPEGEVLDEIGSIRMCCRTKMMAHIDLIDEI